MPEAGERFGDLSGRGTGGRRIERGSDPGLQRDRERSRRERESSRAAQAEAEARRQAEEYYSSGERQRDLDAGRQARYGTPDEEAAQARDQAERYSAERRPGGAYGEYHAGEPAPGGAAGYGGGGAGGGGGGDYGVSDFDEGSADIPIWGDLSGARARRDAANARREADEAENRWSGLSGYMPTADDLAVDYEEEGFVGGPERSELAGAQADAGSVDMQRASLRGLQEIADGQGMTAADQARVRLARDQTGQAMRSSRDADMAQLQARGMGGGGAMLQSQLAAQQMGAGSLANADAQMSIEAQRRHMQALQGLGAGASQMRGQSFGEAAQRGSAADDFNRWQTDYQRGREGANTDWRNQSRESTSRSRQQSYENRERQVAGLTNQWQSAAGGARADQARMDDADEDAQSAVGTIFEEFVG